MRNTYRLLVYEDPPDFFKLKEKWDKLLEKIDSNPFLTPEWMGISFMYFFREGKLRLYAFEESGEPVGIFPLAVKPMNSHVYVTTTSHFEVTDYVDMIVSQQHRRTFLEHVYQDLLGLSLGKGFVLDLPGIPGNSPTLWALKNLAEEMNLEYKQIELTRAPYLTLPETFEDYLFSLKSKDRHEIRRKVSRAHRKANLEYEVLTDPWDVSQGMEDFYMLFSQSSEDKKKFLTDEMKAFFSEVFTMMATRGWIRLYFLKANGQRVSSFLTMDYNDTFYLYNSGYNPDYYSISPGVVLLTFIIEDAIDLKRKKLDFLRGRETYKYKMGAKDLPVYRAILGFTLHEAVKKLEFKECTESYL